MRLAAHATTPGTPTGMRQIIYNKSLVAHFEDKPKEYFLKRMELLIKRCNK
jgi:hypothetical protein